METTYAYKNLLIIHTCKTRRHPVPEYIYIWFRSPVSCSVKRIRSCVLRCSYPHSVCL